MQNVKKYVCNKYFICVAIFIILMVYSAIANVTEYTHDYLSYWTKGDVIWTYGSGRLFTFTEFPETFRGYFAYFFIMLFKHGFAIVFKNAYLGWRFVSAVSVALSLAIFLPYIFDVDIEGRWDYLLRYIILVGILLYICGDMLQKPASDWLSAFFFIVSVTLIKYICNSKKVTISIILSLIAGVALYAAYNTRVAYLYAAVIVLICMVVIVIRKNPLRLLLLIAIFAGALICALPQMQINYKYTGRFSPRVNTEQLYDYKVDLQSAQLYWGMYQPRYETYDGSIEEYPEAGVSFTDKTGKEILEREGLTKEDMSFKTLIGLAVKYPGDMIAIYTRHLASIAVPTWYESCITDIYTSKLLRITLSIWIWIIAFIAFMENFKFDKKDLPKYIFVGGMIIPSVMQCAGAIEIRFFIMCFVLLYFYLCCIVDIKALWTGLKGRRIKVLIVSIMVYFVWLALLDDILAMNNHAVLLINDYLK